MATRPEDFTVGWLCAIEVEFVVACELLDDEYDRSKRPRIHPQDDNAYCFGRIYEHNVVIACLPKGRPGNNPAGLVASHMLLSFPSIKIGLMVGIGGGAPTDLNDMRLGDVVVSSPTLRHGGVIQYDYGKAIQNQGFEATGYLTPPPRVLLSALASLSTTHKRKGHRIQSTITELIRKNPRLSIEYSRPNPQTDRLYKASFVHPTTNICNCSVQSPNLIQASTEWLRRAPRGSGADDPTIHYGLIASANTLLRNALLRDRLREDHDVLCFEMEAAGLMDGFPCVVIRGISDYSDSHKNDLWQGYAAATAAAYAKELLEIIPGSELQQVRANGTSSMIANRGGESLQRTSPNIHASSAPSTIGAVAPAGAVSEHSEVPQSPVVSDRAIANERQIPDDEWSFVESLFSDWWYMVGYPVPWRDTEISILPNAEQSFEFYPSNIYANYSVEKIHGSTPWRVTTGSTCTLLRLISVTSGEIEYILANIFQESYNVGWLVRFEVGKNVSSTVALSIYSRKYHNGTVPKLEDKAINDILKIFSDRFQHPKLEMAVKSYKASAKAYRP